jgi:hypothetical protein
MGSLSSLFESPSNRGRNNFILLDTQHLSKFQRGTSHFAQLVCNFVGNFFVSGTMVFTLNFTNKYIIFGEISLYCRFCNVETKFSEFKDSRNPTAGYFAFDDNFVLDWLLSLLFYVFEKLFIVFL